jgi:hypothetical protein
MADLKGLDDGGEGGIRCRWRAREQRAGTEDCRYG